MDMDLSQYMGMYIDGSKENLDMMDKDLLELEQNPDNPTVIGEIFRAAHTLKGMSATMGFEKVAHLTHEMENILDKLRNAQLAVTQEIVDLLFETFDVLRILVNDSISATDSNVDLNVISQKLISAAAGNPISPSGALKSQSISITPRTPPAPQVSQQAPSPPTSARQESISDIQLNEYEHQIILSAVDSGLHLQLLIVTLVKDCILKAPRAFMVSRTLDELECEILKSIPDTADIEQEKFDLSFKLLLISGKTAQEVSEAVGEITEIEKAEVTDFNPEDFRATSPRTSVPISVPEEPQPLPTPRVSPPPVTSQPTPKASPPPPQPQPRARSVAPPPPTTPPPLPSPPPPPPSEPPKPPGGPPKPPGGPPKKPGPQKPGAVKPAAAAEKRGAQTVRVDMRRLDELMNLVGELVINRTRLFDIGAAHKLKDLNETLARVTQISTALQAVVMQVRMVPIETVFDRFPRMVRDLSKKLNKKINLILEGKETEMDRTVIDEIGDPMVHLIRNSIDHGIETSAERINLGKDETGTIQLIARHEGNNVIIEVKDNGKGIDPDVVGPLAVERGIFTQEQLDKLPPEEVIKVVFLPGFSTAKEVSDLSGRGVGMDAVKSKIDELNGTLEAESKVGQGTRIIIKLPLTLAIMPALMVKLGLETYAIPLGSVQETMDICATDINIIQHQEVTLLRGEVLPIIRLRRVLDVVPIPDEVEKTEDISVVVCSSGEKRGGFIVDELIGQQEIVIKSLGNLIGGLPGIMGATMRGDGSIALILDIPSFFNVKTMN